MFDAIVVGAGLFGQVITAHLRKQGMDILMLDNNTPGAASKPSGSLMKPSWMRSIPSEKQDASFGILDELYGVHDLSFSVGPVKVDTVRWCDPALIQSEPAEVATVKAVGEGFVDVTTDITDITLEARHIIVAAGVWSNTILPEEHKVPKLNGQAGVAFFFKKHQVEQNFISPWAPYRQLVAFNMTDELAWVGDGTAIKAENWTEVREQKSVDRCLAAAGEGAPEPERRFGIRPYVPKGQLEGEPCYLRRASEKLLIATGGAKNGTIAAGWSAHWMAQELT